MPFVALVAAVLAAVHHAEVVALHVGEPGGAVPLALSFMMALIS
jgi:Ca2+/H+ antiporter